MSTPTAPPPPIAPPPIAPPSAPKTWGVWWIVLGAFMALVVGSILGAIPILIAGDPDNEVAGIIAQAFFAAALIVVPFLILRVVGVGPAVDRLGLRPFRFWPGVGWMFAAYGIFFAFAIAYSLVVQTDAEQQVLQEISEQRDAALLIAMGLLVVVAAPISEELFFRGFLFGGLRGRMSFWPAALISGTIFGSIHLAGGSIEVVPPLIVFGVLLAWLYERTGSLGPPMMMHALQNGLAFAITTSG